MSIKFKSNIKEQPIGIFDLNGTNVNPFTNEPYQNLYSNITQNIQNQQLPLTYANMAKVWSTYTVYKYREQILDSIKNNQVTLIKAGTGVGKTVLVPKIALHAFNYQKKVITTIPKRFVTRTNAEFAAMCMDSKLGEYVGYYYKGNNQTSNKTKLIFTTTGSILSKITGNDPYLNEYQCIIIDEAHERSVQTDQILLLIKNALKKRSDLRLVIMSATINLEVFRNYYKSFTFQEIDIPGVSYPVSQYWLSTRPKNWVLSAVETIIKILTTTSEGDILVFGKSSGDGIKVCSLLENHIIKHNHQNKGNELYPFCVKLAGNSTKNEEDMAKDQTSYLKIKSPLYKANYTRKVVVSTNVAESSITIDGIMYVVDSGYEYRESYNPSTMVRSLLEELAPQSSIIQRKGRAGRTKSGFCYHLYSENDFNKLDKYPIPDIQKTDLTSYILDLMRLRYIHNIGDLKRTLNEFISPPEKKFVDSSLKILEAIGAITSNENYGKITKIGEAITKFRGIKPGLANSLLYSHYLNCADEMIDLISTLIIADGKLNSILLEYTPNRKLTYFKEREQANKYEQTVEKFIHPDGDFLTLFNIFKTFKEKSEQLKLKAKITNDVKKSIDQDEEEELSTVIDNIDSQLNYDNNNDIETDFNSNQEQEQNGGGKNHSNLISWCKENYINNKNLEKALFLAREIKDVMKDIFDSNSKSVSKSQSQKSQKSQKLNIKLFNQSELKELEKISQTSNLEHKLIISLVLGNFINISRKTSTNTVYESCFPIQKSLFKFAEDSKLNNILSNNLVMYEELFMSNKQNPFVKGNIVQMIPNSIKELSIVKNKLEKHCISCFKLTPRKIIEKSKKKVPQNYGKKSIFKGFDF